MELYNFRKAFKPYDLKINTIKTEYTESMFSISKSKKNVTL